MLCCVQVIQSISECVFRHVKVLQDKPDQTPPADWKRPYWRHDPTSGRWTAPLPYDQPGGEEQHKVWVYKHQLSTLRKTVWIKQETPFVNLNESIKSAENQIICVHRITLTPPLSHFTLTLIASDMPFSARPSPLPEDRVYWIRNLQEFPSVWIVAQNQYRSSISPCSQPWRRSCCSANFKPRLFSCTTSAICLKESLKKY